jgi:hypothetical protein
MKSERLTAEEKKVLDSEREVARSPIIGRHLIVACIVISICIIYEAVYFHRPNWNAITGLSLCIFFIVLRRNAIIRAKKVMSVVDKIKGQ